MTLTEQELRCVERACAHLGAADGSSWRQVDGPTLDELHPQNASPEVIVTDGVRTAAIEVKRLTHQNFQQLGSYVEYLRSRLAPSIGGHYWLAPPHDFKLPIDQRLIRHLKREIGRIAPTLAPGDSGSVRYPRSTYVSLIRTDVPGYIYCCHQDLEGDVSRVSNRLPGSFMLVDCDTYEHSFLTDEAREEFALALVAACEQRIATGNGPLTWNEEWGLHRFDEDDGDEPHPPSVHVLAVEVIDVAESTTGSVTRMIDAALQKFASRRWADLHVLVLEKADGILPTDRVSDAISAIDPSDLHELDLILYIDDATTTKLWPA